MKKYKYLFLLIGGLSIFGCSDLEEEPVGILAPESYFTSLDKVQIAVQGAFAYMHNRYFLTRETGMTLMLRSDMVEISDPNTSLDRRDHNSLTDAATNDQTYQGWKIMYQIIASANQAIAGADQLNEEAAVKNPIIAQAYFARAFTYFHLVQQFGAIPYFDAPIDNVQEASNVSKTPVADVYANIIADLKFAKEWLPNTQTNKSIPAKSAASAFLASTYLTMGDYPNAYAEAKDFIGKKGDYDIDLEPDFQNLFNADIVTKEPIFILDYTGDSSLGNYSTDYLVPLTGIRKDLQFGSTQEGWAVMVPALKVYTDWDPLDYRRAVSFNATAKFGSVTAPDTPYTGFFAADSRNKNQPYIAKYTRFRGATPGAEGRASSTKYAMIRYAEVLLIAAEALNEVTPGTTEADGYVNQVRKRARDGAVGSVPSLVPANVSGLSQTDFRTMILEERRLELAFEQKRWYDIVRRKLGTTVFSASGLEGAKTFTDANYLIAIPANEVINNPKLGL
ncbi:putative outer membrane starch-binding protein [Mariniflexile fucanivorans]|uniref:Putative outer membrane starch-binding protein n=1 Tax=Mariniflexile fucanivorans TaxID=264023 RepID=A0A4R1RM84_9FLAO|nr:RagB/SusD family nutrient uptake outer membrane protein [Mariniflexile fucanivorans]TCL66912.1 putative outer membrane starch-binding protein [Mariniflexile fucanivorans]